MTIDLKVVSLLNVRRFPAAIIATAAFLVFLAPEQVEADEEAQVTQVSNVILFRDGRVVSVGMFDRAGFGDGFEAVAIEAGATTEIYWILSSSGEVLAFGGGEHYGDVDAIVLNEPPVDLVSTASGLGYWIVAADGGVFAFGDAGYFGSLGGLALGSPIVGIARTESGRGYWLFGADGGVFAFGDAGFYGSLPELVNVLDLAGPIVGAIRSAAGSGYLLTAADGGVFAFGDAVFSGSRAPVDVDAEHRIVAIGSGYGAGYSLNFSHPASVDFGFARPVRITSPGYDPANLVVDVTDFRPDPEA